MVVPLAHGTTAKAATGLVAFEAGVAGVVGLDQRNNAVFDVIAKRTNRLAATVGFAGAPMPFVLFGGVFDGV